MKKVILKYVTNQIEIGKKIEEKFESLATNIETQIYKNFLKPSLSTIDRTIKTNFEEIKNKIKTLGDDDSQSNANDSKGYSLNSFSRFEDDSVNLKNGEMYKKLDYKVDEINSLGGRLYEKLLEKVNNKLINQYYIQEKKLNKLKNETTQFLKKRINTKISDV